MVTASSCSRLSSVILCTAALLVGCGGGSSGAKVEEAVPVRIAVVEKKNVAREVRAFGSVDASSTVDVRAQVQGLVTEVHFKEGDFVKRGQLLFTVDTRPYRASLAAAQAELSRNRAVAEQMRVEAERATALRQEGVASDRDVAKAKADAASSAADVKLGQAQIASASLNVTFTRITAPIDGRTGALLVYPGNLVSAADAQPLVVLRSLSPVFVRFTVSQEHLGTIRERLGKEPLIARVTPRGEPKKTIEAPVTFLENSVDASTGTITLKATYLNAAQELWPGSSVDVVLVTGTDEGATVIPESALQRSQSGTLVFVIGQDGRATPRPVQILRTTETEALVASGLEPGERVATDGLLRLRRGIKVAEAAPPAKVAASTNAEQKRPEGL
jgi:membrane fusion protein, multidrug efflux system